MQTFSRAVVELRPTDGTAVPRMVLSHDVRLLCAMWRLGDWGYLRRLGRHLGALTDTDVLALRSRIVGVADSSIRTTGGSVLAFLSVK
jgi:hypothetical protein